MKTAFHSLADAPKTFWWSFAACTTATLIPLWCGKFLPMTDLPQHAAQISIIQHLHDPAYGFARQFELHWFIPYALVYWLAWMFAKVVGIMPALSLTITLGVLGLPLALFVLLKETESDIWWSLLGFPLAFGYSFYWGFVSFVVAIPLAVLFLASTYEFGRFPTWGRGASLICIGVLLFFSHGLAFGLAMITSFFVALTSVKSLKGLAVRLLPFIGISPIVYYWFRSPDHEVPQVKSGIEWAFSGFHRLLEIAPTLLSNRGDLPAILFAYGMILMVLLGARFRVVRLRTHFPFFLVLTLFLLLPHHAMAISLIYQRLVIFVFLFFLILWKPSELELRRRWAHVGLVVLVISWMSILTLRFLGFNQEAKDFDKILAAMEPNKSAVNLVFEGGSGYGAPEVFSHFPAYYQAEKGGAYSFSFAFSYKSVARYKPHQEPLAAGLALQLGNPDTFDWKRHGCFDYYVVRSVTDRTAKIFREHEQDIELAAHHGAWWVYRKKETS